MNAESGASEKRCCAYGCGVSCFCASALCETGCVVLGVFWGRDGCGVTVYVSGGLVVYSLGVGGGQGTN
jgi:hypothetical protein